MEPIYHFATPQSIEQLKTEQDGKQVKKTQQCQTICCDKNNEKSNAAKILSIALLMITTIFGGTTIAQAQTAMANKDNKPGASNKSDIAYRSLDDITFPTAEFKRGAYLKMRTVYLQVPVEKFRINAFPANSSAETRAELDFLLHLQQNRTPEEIDRIKLMANIYFDPLNTNPTDPDYTRNVNSLFYIGRDLGTWFNPEKLPVTTQVLQNVIQDATFYFFSLKADFNRARPYHLEPRLQNLEAPGHASYPSGHSSASHVHAYILSEIFPEYKDHFMGVASEMAFSRETLGVHYPSDSKAGKEFARRFVGELMKNRKFRADFEAMKTEITRARFASQLTRK